jgi:MoaA/NifB/PqqE/SkfB family radical SAM enzyme
MAVSWVVFHVTDRCQLNCKHCLRDPEKASKDISLDLVRKVLDEARDLYGCDHVGLTGGEPTLHPQFPELIETLVDREMSWHMVTNGIRFDTKVLALLDRDPRIQPLITAIDFSIDGADAEVHDRIRGEGSYRDAMKAIALCNMRNIPFVLQMTINAYNAHQIEQFALGAAGLGAKRVSFGMTQPTGTYLDAEMFLPRSEWRKVQDRLDRLGGLLTIPVTYTEGFYNQHVFHECEPFRSEIIHVDYSGYLNLCCMHSGVPGGNGTSDAIADLKQTSLISAHKKMLEMVQDFRMAKLDDIARRGLEGWDYYPCNYCLEYFGKAHWTDEGASGAGAKRERWRGAWSPEKHTGTTIPVNKRLPVIV